MEQTSGFPLRRVGPGERITLGRDGEHWLDDWMHRNAFVAWADLERPWEVEAQLLKQFPCPLNLSHNAHHPFAEFLKTSRKAALRRAHQMSVDVEYHELK